MKLVGLMPVRNEAWCLGLSLRIALMWCDEVVVCVHASTDNSLDIAHEICHGHPKRVLVLADDDPVWHEMEQRQEMLHTARELMHATHIAMIDADEVLAGLPLCPIGHVRTVRGATNHQPLIRDTVEMLRDDQVLLSPGYNLRGSLMRYHSNGIWGNRWFSLAFLDDPALHWAGDRFHAREPQGKKLTPYRPIQQGQGGILHLWGCSERRLRAKHALYKVMERLRWPGRTTTEAEYNLWRSPEDSQKLYPMSTDFHVPWTFADVPESWWKPYEHLMRYLDVDAEPWQESEVRRLVVEHGAETFRGLDLFGVA